MYQDIYLFVKLGKSYHIVYRTKRMHVIEFRLMQERRLMSAIAIEQSYIRIQTYRQLSVEWYIDTSIILNRKVDQLVTTWLF